MNDANTPESLLTFPTDFPIKAMGRFEPDFEALVLTLIAAHTGDSTLDRVSTRLSSNGRFLSVTVTITAHSREQLDAIYRSLSASERVLMVL